MMNKTEDAQLIYEAEIYMRHAPDIKTRISKLSARMLEFADDLAAIVVMIDSGEKIAREKIESAKRTGHAPADIGMSNAEKSERNG